MTWTKCIQDILQSNTMVCRIFVAQKCGHAFYIVELKWSPACIKMLHIGGAWENVNESDPLK